MINIPQDPRVSALRKIFPRVKVIEYVDLSDQLKGPAAKNSYVLRFGRIESVVDTRSFIHFLHSCMSPWQLIGLIHPIGLLVEDYECSTVVCIYDMMALLDVLSITYPMEYFLAPCLSATLYRSDSL